MTKNNIKNTFESELHAWNWIHENFKGKQWYHDDIASEKAGYEIYRDLDEYYNYVCCLGDRLELNLKEDNQSINLWIEKEDDKLYVGLTKHQILLIKGALCQLSNNLNTSSIMSGKYTEINASIECLNLVKMLNTITLEQDS